MTSDRCREMRSALGAVALGGAEPAEALALRAHLDGCPECRAELRELMEVAAALPLADPSRISGDLSQPPPALVKGVLGRVAAQRSARRTRVRRRIAVVSATTTAIAAAILAFVLALPGGSAPGTHVVFAASSGVKASATLRPDSYGTEVAFHVSGLDNGHYYWLWLTGSNGVRIPAGSFEGTTAPADVDMTAAVPLSDARRIWVTDEHNNVVLDEHLGGTTS